MQFLHFKDFRKSIILFDLDDTLVKSSAKIKVTNNKGESFEITPEEFTHFKKRPNQKLDMSQFKDFEILKNAKLKWPILNVFKSALQSSIPVGVITAREDADMIWAYLKYLGLDMFGKLDKSLIFAVNGTSEFSGSTPERKKQAVEKLINKGFKNIVMYDDDAKNLKEIYTLTDKYPNVNISTKKVKS